LNPWTNCASDTDNHEFYSLAFAKSENWHLPPEPWFMPEAPGAWKIYLTNSKKKRTTVAGTRVSPLGRFRLHQQNT
jgi:hypothetical protein